MKAERYFEVFHMSEKESVENAILCLEGVALVWFQWEHQRRPIHRWEELKGLLLRQFRPADQGSLQEQWLAIYQTGIVADYCLEFVEKATHMERVPESFYMAAFINGLEEEVRRELRIHSPVCVESAMDMAIKIDHKLYVDTEI